MKLIILKNLDHKNLISVPSVIEAHIYE